MSRRIINSRIVAILLPALAVATVVSGQTPEREKLTEPTYRVSKSTDTAAVKPIPAPSAVPPSPEALPATRPEIDPASSDLNGSYSDKLPITPDPTVEPPVQMSEAEQVFEQAMMDAAQTLAHIKSDVKDYTCIFIKREQVKGKIIGPQYMFTKVRSRQMDGDKIVVPFSVYMKFIKPTNLKGREALFIENVNNGKLLAKEGGLKGRVLPPVYLPTTSRFVMADNRYPITEFGIETLTKRLLERGHDDRNIDDCIISYKDGATVCGRPCRYLEVRRPTPKVGDDAKFGMNVPLAQVFMDSELNVPIRYVAFDWPKNGNPPQVLEEYTYQNLKLNVGLTDADFDRDNPEYGF